MSTHALEGNFAGHECSRLAFFAEAARVHSWLLGSLNPRRSFQASLRPSTGRPRLLLCPSAEAYGT